MGDSSCYKLMLHYIRRHKFKTVHFPHLSLRLTNKWTLFTAVRMYADNIFILYQRAKAFNVKWKKS
jgi:hypothetical protein